MTMATIFWRNGGWYVNAGRPDQNVPIGRFGENDTPTREELIAAADGELRAAGYNLHDGFIVEDTDRLAGWSGL
jgi:hypothetical protein